MQVCNIGGWAKTRADAEAYRIQAEIFYWDGWEWQPLFSRFAIGNNVQTSLLQDLAKGIVKANNRMRMHAVTALQEPC